MGTAAIERQNLICRMTQAKENLADLNEKGADAVGGNVLEFMESILMPDEIAESELRVMVSLKFHHP